MGPWSAKTPVRTLQRELEMIRIARPEDAAEIARIYTPAVRDEVTSFETVVVSTEQMADRITSGMERFPWLVDDDQRGALCGYAYAAPFRNRQAYQWSVETSVYVADRLRRRGHGRALYEQLFDILVEMGYFTALAGIVIPNEASVCLHESMGFQAAGKMMGVGYKLGAWRDVGWWIKPLSEPTGVEPPLPIPFQHWQRQKKSS